MKLNLFQISLFVLFGLGIGIMEINTISDYGLFYGILIFPLTMVFPMLYLALIYENQSKGK